MESKIINIARMLNNLTSISARCYKDGNMIEYLPPSPDLKGLHDSFRPYLSEIDNFKTPTGCITTPHGFCFGFVKNGGELLVLGPVKQTPTPKAILNMLADHLDPSGEHRDSVVRALKNCPKLSFYSLLPMIAESYNLLTFTEHSIKDSTTQFFSTAEIDITFYDGEIGDISRQSRSIEDLFEEIIASGNIGALNEWFSNNQYFHFYFDITSDHLRNVKDCFIVVTTLYARAAIRGGLDNVYVIKLQIDAVRSAEMMDSAEDILKLQTELAYRFTHDVAENNKKHLTKLVRNTAQIIQRDIFKPLKVSDIADELAVSRNYLSTLFENETGYTIKEYILMMKVREAKSLLNSSDKTLISISTALGFSSQSHFTRVFKKETGMTPREFRDHPVSDMQKII